MGTYTYIHICVFTHIHIYAYTHIYTYLHIYIYTYMHIYIYTYIHIYIYTYIHIYMHTYRHTKDTSSVVDSVRIGHCVSGVYTGVRVGGVCNGWSNWGHSSNNRLYMYVLLRNITGGIVNIGFSRDLLMDISFGNITGSVVDIGESCRGLLTLGHGGSTGQGDNGQEDKCVHGAGYETRTRTPH